MALFLAGGTPPLRMRTSKPTKPIIMRIRHRMCPMDYCSDSEGEHYSLTP